MVDEKLDEEPEILLKQLDDCSIFVRQSEAGVGVADAGTCCGALRPLLDGLHDFQVEMSLKKHTYYKLLQHHDSSSIKSSIYGGPDHSTTAYFVSRFNNAYCVFMGAFSNLVFTLPGSHRADGVIHTGLRTLLTY